ncbi:MAG: tetratricopeptide repeat protein [Spirochaetales bacterium]|nr:tetratricopeptide repeat protein [Spirochaetales bacterium]
MKKIAAGLLLAFFYCRTPGAFELQQEQTLRKLIKAGDLARSGSRDAGRLFGEACQSFLLLDDRPNEIRCLVAHASYRIKRTESKEAGRLLDRATELSVQSGGDYRGNILSTRILLFIREKKEELARDLCDEALKLSLSSPSRKQILAYRGYLSYRKGEKDLALNDFLQARNAGDPELDSYTSIHLGKIYKEKGNFKQAEKYALKALQLDRDGGRADLLAYDYEILGQIMQAAERPGKAREFYQRSFDLYSALGDRRSRRVAGFMQDLP